MWSSPSQPAVSPPPAWSGPGPGDSASAVPTAHLLRGDSPHSGGCVCVLQASTQNARNNPGHRKGDRPHGPRRATCQVTPSAGTPLALCPAHLWRPSTAPWSPGESVKTACWAHQGLLTPRAPAGPRHLRLLRCMGSLDPLQAFSRTCWTLIAPCTWGIRLWFGEVFTPKDLVSSGGTLGWLGIRQTWNPLPLRPRIKGQ